jgi:hypothetical protein
VLDGRPSRAGIWIYEAAFDHISSLISQHRFPQQPSLGEVIGGIHALTEPQNCSGHSPVVYLGLYFRWPLFMCMDRSFLDSFFSSHGHRPSDSLPGKHGLHYAWRPGRGAGGYLPLCKPKIEQVG